jgi:acetylcholinesterase
MLFEHGRFVRVPVLVGDDTNEGTYFAPNATSADQVKQFMKNNYPGLTAAQLDAIIYAYPLSSLQPLLPVHAPYYTVGSAAYGDSTFTCPGNTIAAAVTRYVGANRVWNYRYNVLDPGNAAAGIGVPHASETEAIFGVGESQSSHWPSYNPGGINANVVPLVMDYWISFIRSLDPNTYREPGSPYWENWVSSSSSSSSPIPSLEAKRLRIQTNETAMESVPNDIIGRCSLWIELASAMEL